MSIVICQAQDQILTKNQKGNTGGLSFLQSMSDITTIVKDDTAYVHPNEKRSVSKLNEKSLEMCTEFLGTETGSGSGDELSLLAFEEITTRVTALSPEPKPNLESEKATMMSRNNSFPPPIKFLEGSKHNRMVKSYGEDGRLVVQAIRVSSPPRCFVAERGEGRLRLCLSPESSLLSQNLEEEEEEETEEGKSGNKKLSISSRCKENGRVANKPMQHFWVSA